MMLFYVCHADDDGNNHDMFVSAASHLEAFVLWREDWLEGETPITGEENEVDVYCVPRARRTAQVHGWDHATKEVFRLGFDSLGARAILAAHRSRVETTRGNDL